MNAAAFILAFVAMLLAGCETNSPTNSTHSSKREAQANKAAIQRVVDQMQAITDEFKDSAALLMKNPMLAGVKGDQETCIAKMNSDLDSIDISNCPADFRIAFTKYCQSLRASQEYMKSITGWRGVLRGFLHPTSVLTTSEDADRALKPLEIAGNELDLICASYNVKIKL